METIFNQIIVLGDIGVGKSSIIHKMCDKKFNPNIASTIGIDVTHKKVHIKKKDLEFGVNIYFWDTNGQEKYKSLTSSYLKNTHIFIYVFDVSNIESYRNVSNWKKFVSTYISEENMLFSLLIGNKIDIKPSFNHIKFYDAINYAQQQNMMYIELSAKEDITKIETLLELVLIQLDLHTIYRIQSNLIKLNSSYITNQKSDKKKCC